MYNIVSWVKEALDNNVYQQAVINVTLKNSETLTLTNADIVENSLSVDRYTVTGGSIALGTGVAAELNVKLNNHDGRFNDVNFAGAQMNVGIKIDDGTHIARTVPMGIFLVSSNPRHLSTISITALDKMTLLDKPVDRSQHTVWPKTMPGFLGDCVYQVGGIAWNPITIQYLSRDFTNANIAIRQLPVTEGILTYRQLLMWCAGILGAVLYVNWEGSLDLMWYDCGTYDETQGDYTADYTSTPSTRYSSDIYDEQIEFTGLFFKGEDKVEHLVPVGGGDYAFNLSDNKLILNTLMSMTDDHPDPYALMVNLNTHLNIPWDYSMFSASVKPAPYLWPGDSVDFVKITDEQENHYLTTLTHVHYVLNGATTIGASGETQEEHQVAPASSGSASVPDVSANNLGVAGDANITGNLTVGGTARFALEDIGDDYTFTKTSGNANVTKIQAKRFGCLVSMIITASLTAATSAGSNVLVGTLSGGPLPAIGMTSVASYSGSSVPVLNIGTNGAITVRAIAASYGSNGATAYWTFMFLTEDS